MVVNIEVISKEMIKPSSPTPHHLRNLKLSFLDQLAPPVYVPIILFYQSELGFCNRAKKSQLLKQSLSDSLTRFYPLAGTIDDNVSIDCNDAGVEYIEAQVYTRLTQVIENPNMEELKQYLPIEPYGGRRKIVLAIKISFFDCGGIAIGVCMSHKIADGSSLVTFVKAWAATSIGDTSKTMHSSSFDLACHFPPRDLSGFTPTVGITEEKIETRRFVFDKEKLAALKEVASNPRSQVKNPTRVEAVSAFIWNHFMEISKAKLGCKKIFAAIHAVNLRTRMNPPLPENKFGNLWGFAYAVLMESEGGYQNLVFQLRNAIRKIDNEYVKKLKSGDEYLDYIKSAEKSFCKGGIEFCNFSSWCRFPVYDVNFGWGRPVWVCTTTMPFKNLVILMSTKCGEGIEAWVNMVEDDMGMLERDIKLLSLVANSIDA